jgi:hypothetical protein
MLLDYLYIIANIIEFKRIQLHHNQSYTYKTYNKYSSYIDKNYMKTIL